jgi:transcriptional regulator with XRE-family HTH domain
MTTTQALASEVRAEMARRRLGPNDLAAAIDVHRVTASAIYNGRAPIDVERLDAIAAWLGLTPASLLARAEAAADTGSVA